MKDLVVADKYAKALFNEAGRKNELTQANRAMQEIVRISRLRKSLKVILADPFIAISEKEVLIASVLGDKRCALSEHFVLLLVEKRRLDLIDRIAEKFQEEVDRAQNIQAITVQSAMAMSETEQKRLLQKLEVWLKSKVRMDLQVDPSLIGGLVVETRDHVLDESLKGQLKRLRKQLAA
jgi:F-type H+-transporting ATPase subunit delta